MSSTPHRSQNGSVSNESVTNSMTQNNLRKSINLHQQQFYDTSNLSNGFIGSGRAGGNSISGGINEMSYSSQYQAIRKYNGTDVDDDDDDNDDESGKINVSIKRANSGNAVGGDLDLNRKIKLNGGNELRIDEKNISLHLNNPFVTNYIIQRQQQQQQQSSLVTPSSITQSASNPQISNVINNQRLSYSQQQSFQLNNTNATNEFKLQSGYSGFDSATDIANESLTYRPKRPHSIAGVSSASTSLKTMMMTNNELFGNRDTSGGGGDVGAAGMSTATTTMTYSSNSRIRNTNPPLSLNNSSVHNSETSSNSVLKQRMEFSQANESAQQRLSYSQYMNSPSRLTNNRNLQELSLCTPPAVSTTTSAIDVQQSPQYQQRIQKVPPAVVPRRSHSTPRPIQALNNQPQNIQMNGSNSNVNASVPQRPRSLDRATISTLGMNIGRPPPIPPSRRFSQPLHSSANTTATTKNSNTNFTTTSSQQRTTASGVLHPSPMSGMRQSATFHGQLSRHAVSNASSLGYNKGESESMGTIRRKTERPLSYAYGTLPDQAFLENQLRMYSEQLRTITESVRKYSEQAKILSEMKRQQQMQQQKRTFELPTQSSSNNKPTGLRQSDSNIYANAEYETAEDPQTPSHQLKLFLESIRNTMKDDNTEPESNTYRPQLTQQQPPQKQPAQKMQSDSATGNSSRTSEPVTPSDQLRQFLDAIRTNQLPDEQPDDIAQATQRFSKFKEKLENTRSKSTPNFDKFQQSPVISESFNQFSDNLRLMNEDLEALAAIKTPKKSMQNISERTKSLTSCDSNSNGAMNRTNGGGNGHGGSTINGAGNSVNNNCKNALDFNQILDSFTHLTNNSNSMDAIDYLRKCSEALRQTSEQLRIATMHSNQYDSPESSSCSTTPGSIREAVQNLLQQPRNGFQIMDDRMKLFIDILDSQSKFSQVNDGLLFLIYHMCKMLRSYHLKTQSAPSIC